MHIKKACSLSGWAVFALAAGLYLKTMEPTASFWDCGEFIACAWKLEVGHQPGAPFFLLLGRVFSLWAGDPSQVAVMINALSALASAFTVMLLFHTIVLMAQKLVHTVNLHSTLTVIGCGLTGALAYAVSDTFWFSAVEGEVYATSSLFTALVFWAMLKWEASAEKPAADRWIILIAYLMGLSIGVHLLNLLAIPALVIIYYFRKFPYTRKGFIRYVILSFTLLAIVTFILIPWIIKIAAWFDLLSVNSVGLPLNSGALFYIGCLFCLLAFLIWRTQKNNKTGWNRILTGFAVFLAGYSSYLVLAIRADANPPINLNKVSNPFSLLQYINREQYVTRPLIYGPWYNAPVTGIISKYTRIPVNGRYVKKESNSKYVYDKDYMTLFPRMSGTDPQDIEAYKRWTGAKNGKPSFSDNLTFFLKYQVGYMYLRYFMWNFSGRQNENQGRGDILSGNWITGIGFIDKLRLGSWDTYPDTLKSNKGRNAYYMLPLLLGIAGLLYHYKNRRKDFTVVLFFFIMTGLATVVYLNEVPVTPRERDYAVGGSFYVFSIWLGLGVMGIISLVSRRWPGKYISIPVIALSLCIPLLMAAENYDDHDRSHRYIARDTAWDYLQSCAPNAILFTNADNDTYPIWYAQEVEGIRTDVRVVLAPFLNADWYIEKLADWNMDAAPVPHTIDMEKYASGKLNYVPFYQRTNKAAKLEEVIAFMESSNPKAMVRTRDGSQINYYPTNHFIIPVEGDTGPVQFKVNDRALPKHQIVILDIIATNNWKRPVYFLSTQVPDELGLTEYLQLDGFAYRLVPEKFAGNGTINRGSINTEALYEKLMNRFRWGNMNDPEVFMDQNCIRTAGILGIRNSFARLAEELLKAGEKDRALKVLDRCMEIMPHESVPYDAIMLRIISAYLNAGAGAKAVEISNEYESMLLQEMQFYNSLLPRHLRGLEDEIAYTRFVLEEIGRMKTVIGNR